MTFGPLEVLFEVSTRLQGESIEYFLVGSLASMAYSNPRFTRDIDLVVQIGPQQIQKFIELFPLSEYYCPPFEVLQDEVIQRGSFNLIHHQSGLKVDIIVQKNTEFYKVEFQRRRLIELAPGIQIFIASPEDVIIKKLDFYREGGSEKHLTDIRDILSLTSVDQEYLELWIKKFGLQIEWAKVRS